MENRLQDFSKKLLQWVLGLIYSRLRFARKGRDGQHNLRNRELTARLGAGIMAPLSKLLTWDTLLILCQLRHLGR